MVSKKRFSKKHIRPGGLSWIGNDRDAIMTHFATIINESNKQELEKYEVPKGA